MRWFSSVDAGKAATITQKPCLSCLLPKPGQPEVLPGLGPSPPAPPSHGHRGSLKATGNAAPVQQGSPAGALNVRGNPQKQHFALWLGCAGSLQSVRLCKQVFQQEFPLLPSHCTPQCCAEEPALLVSRCQGQAHTPAALRCSNICAACVGRAWLLGQQALPCIWTIFRNISPGLGFSPPNALRDKHTAAASTSSSISGFAE